MIQHELNHINIYRICSSVTICIVCATYIKQ